MRRTSPRTGALLAAMLVLAGTIIAACDSEFITATGPDAGGAAGAGGLSEGGAAGDPAVCSEPCGEDMPTCSEDGCVACSNDAACGEGVCDPERGCVECRDGSQCPATQPVCDDGACVACTDSDDCSQVSGKPYCSEVSGACVQCLPGDHGTCGEGRLCHADLQECVDVEEGIAATCEPCVSDAHCVAGHRCVRPDVFGEEGYSCLPEASPGCDDEPFVNGIQALDAESGLLVSVCGLRTTSCAGFLDFSQAVEGCSEPEDLEPEGAGDAACGGPGTEDNTLCRAVDGGARCTYTCLSSTDCPCGASCDDDACTPSATSEPCPQVTMP